MSALRLYVRFRRAYRRRGVASFYSRRETWAQAKFCKRMGRV